MFPISLLSFSVHSLSPEPSCSISSFSSFIVSIVLHPLVLSPFHCTQFLSNLAQYSLSYLLSDYPNNFLAMNCPGNSPLLNIPSSFSCFLTSSVIERQWVSLVITLGGCSRRTQWSSSLDWTTTYTTVTVAVPLLVIINGHLLIFDCLIW